MSENREIIIPIRVNSEELDVIKRLANRLGVKNGPALRQAALEKARSLGILPKGETTLSGKK